MNKAILIQTHPLVFKESSEGWEDTLRKYFDISRIVLPEVTIDAPINIEEEVIYFVFGCDYYCNIPIIVKNQLASGKKKNCKLVLWYTEPLPTDKSTSVESENYFTNLKLNKDIYDYIFVMDYGMNEYTNSHGVETSFASVGYHSSFENHDINPSKQDLVTFVGGLHFQRRRDIVADIKSRGIQVNDYSNFWGDARTKAIKEAKVFLCLHSYSHTSLECVRFMHGAVNKSIIVSEKVDYSQPYIDGKHFLMGENVVDVVEQVMNNYEEYKHFEEDTYTFVTQEHTMQQVTDNMINTLESRGILCPTSQ